MFYEVVFGGGFLSLLIWFLLFATSTIAVVILIRLVMEIQRKNFIDDGVVAQLSEFCRKKELDHAYGACVERTETFSQIMNEVFRKYHIESKTNEEVAAPVLDKTARAILRKINSLQMCGNIAPMLGLLGTVIGMFAAFMGLGTHCRIPLSVAKEHLRACSIAQPTQALDYFYMS